MTVPHTGPQAVKVDLDRSTGVTVFQTVRARLEWTAQDRIRVVDLDPTGNPAGEQVLLDIAPQEITKARYMPGAPSQLALTTGTGKIKVFPDAAVPSPEPWESLAQYNQRMATASVPPGSWWVDRLKSYGVDAKLWSYGKIVGYSFLGVIALLVVIAVLVGLFG